MTRRPDCKARLIACYLPQYHPIPENDEAWGKGFTEWTNVAKAKPLFPGHYQPCLPADLGFYDLRLPETRIAQAELAREHGIEGFLYWHYWFAGKRLLERPFNEVIKSGEPDFPFCLGWANESWTGIWHGCADKMLMEQTYPGRKDEETHFYACLQAFFDKRYITIDGKPAFYIYSPQKLPEPKRFLDHWRELAVKEGLKGIYFLGNGRLSDHGNDGYDGLVQPNPGLTFVKLRFPEGANYNIYKKVVEQTPQQRRGLMNLFGRATSKPAQIASPTEEPTVFFYKDFISLALPGISADFDEYPCVIPNWDNTARCGNRAHVLHDSTPELFRMHLKEAIEQVSHHDPEKRIVFIKSWNEWAEGNYLEPDMKFGRGYLEVCRDELLLK